MGMKWDRIMLNAVVVVVVVGTWHENNTLMFLGDVDDCISSDSY